MTQLTRCPAAHPADPDPCTGLPVVTVLDKDNAGLDGCELHAARLLSSFPGGRCYGLPHDLDGASIRVFLAAHAMPQPYLTLMEALDQDMNDAVWDGRGIVSTPDGPAIGGNDWA
jgi:hypothetical protein